MARSIKEDGLYRCSLGLMVHKRALFSRVHIPTCLHLFQSCRYPSLSLSLSKFLSLLLLSFLVFFFPSFDPLLSDPRHLPTTLTSSSLVSSVIIVSILSAHQSSLKSSSLLMLDARLLPVCCRLCRLFVVCDSTKEKSSMLASFSDSLEAIDGLSES